jgi:hypothetical protein
MLQNTEYSYQITHKTHLETSGILHTCRRRGTSTRLLNTIGNTITELQNCWAASASASSLFY